jgi:hypothetical protein
MALIPMMSNKQIDEQEARTAIPAAPPNNLISELGVYVRSCWVKAYQNKTYIQQKLLDNLRAFNGEYDPAILFEIRKLRGSEQFLSLTPTKCIAALSWLTDIYDQPVDRPWDIQPTPMATIPLDMENEIRQQVIGEVVSLISQYSKVTGSNPQQLMKQFLPQVRKRIYNKVQDKAKEGIEEFKLAMQDQLVEGGWYDAYKQCLFDLVVYKAAILKGATFRRVRRFARDFNSADGVYTNNIESLIIPTFERKSPFQIYPAPDSLGVQDSYLCDLFPLSLKQIYDLIGVEGFNEDAIRRVLSQYQTGGLREWAVIDTEIIRLTSSGQQTTFLDTDKIDVVEFWGDVPGEYLRRWGMSVEEIPDEHKRYDVCVWLIGNEVIKAMLNPNPMGLKPYSVASYVNIPGSFWGRGLPELITDLQQICNALVRAIVNNAAFASSPMVEYDIDRIPPGFDQALYPLKTIESTSKMMESPAMKFYQAQLTAPALQQVLAYFTQLADQYSLPSYAHGGTQVGGAGRTSSGLSMLMNSANRVIKNVVKNADQMIKESLRHLFVYNMYYNADKFSFIGDVDIVAKGVNAMLQEEQLAVRRMEFLNSTNNPVDLELVGKDGRRELLKQVASSIDLETLVKVFPQIDSIDGLRAELEGILAKQREDAMAIITGKPPMSAGTSPTGIGAQVPMVRPRALNVGGQPAGGQESRLLPQSSVEMPRGGE